MKDCWTLLIVIIGACASSLAPAQEENKMGLPTLLKRPAPSHLAAAEKLIEVLDVVENMHKSMMSSFEGQLKQMQSMGLGANQMQEIRGSAENLVKKVIDDPALKQRILELFLEEFTEQELRQVIAFYTSALGKKVKEKIPQIYEKGGELGRKLLKKNQAEFVKTLNNALQNSPRNRMTPPTGQPARPNRPHPRF